MSFEHIKHLGMINNIQYVDEVKITEMCIDDKIYYVYNDFQEYANIIHQISDNLGKIVDNIQQFLRQKLEQGHIQTVNEVGIMVDLDKFNPVTYALLDEK